MTTTELLSKLTKFAPREWRGRRVYLRYPRGYGGAGGGELGYVEVTGGVARFVGSAPADLLAEVKAVLA